MAISAFNQGYLDDYEYYIYSQTDEDGKRNNTCVNYIIDIKQFLNYIGDKKCTEADNRDANEWVRSLKGRDGDKIKPKTKNRKISSLNSFYKRLEAKKLVVVNPFSEVDLAKIKKRSLDSSEVLDGEEIARFKKVLDKEVKSPTYKRGMNPKFVKSNALRDRALFNLLVDSGMRIEELLGLTMDRIEIIERQNKELVRIIIPVELDKNKQGRMTTATLKTIQYINEYRESLPFVPDNNYVFLSQTGKRLSNKDANSKLKRYLKLAGIDKELTPHKIRHTSATQLINKGNEHGKVAKMLGHSINTLEAIYLHQTDDSLDVIL